MATAATQPIPAPSPWRTIIRAMGQTGGASLLSGLLSLLATKLIATTLGPAHLATLATLQQLRQAAVSTATLAGQTALVQGASSTDALRRRMFVRTVVLLIACATLGVSVLFWLAPSWIAEQAGLPPSLAGLIAPLSAAIAASAIYVVLAALLNAAGAIGPLALVQLAAPAAMAFFALPAARGIAAGRPEWFVLLLAASSTIAAIAAAWALRQERRGIGFWFAGYGSWFDRPSARHFATISGSLFFSGLLSSWVLVAVRARILQMDGLAVGGQFDAAWTISMNQAGLILASMQTYYLPVLARTGDSQQRGRHIERVLTVAAISAATLITAFVILKPQLLTLLYSDEFRGASQYLRWTLLGDYLKITSWILSIPLLAAADMRSFLAADIAAYATFFAGSIALNTWMSAGESAAAAFVAMYLAHLCVCGFRLWQRGELQARAATAAIWLAGLLLVGTASLVFWSQS